MTVMHQRFLESLRASTRSFPQSLGRTYSWLIGELRSDPDTQGFDHISMDEGFGDPTLRGVAHRLHYWFPTHFHKFQEALVSWEGRCRETGVRFLLERPQVTFVDLGCGAGAASAAVLSILQQYQSFLRSSGAFVDTVQVRLIGLDPNAFELAVYDRLLGTYSESLDDAFIRVTWQTICGRFPEDTPDLVDALGQSQSHVLVVGMSNLIKWIWDEYKDELDATHKGEPDGMPPSEVEALCELAERTQFDILHVIGVAVQTGRYRRLLPRKLSALFTRVRAALARVGRPPGHRWGGKMSVLFENPQGSHWATKYRTHTSTFYIENTVDSAPAWARDSALRDVLSYQALERAWAKVRSYLRYESLTDQVELKLFEHDLESSLGALQEACLDHEYWRLNSQYHMPYWFPKNSREGRPRSLPRLEEQVVSASVVVRSATELDGPCPKVSYSHRLAPRDSEFLYDYWFAGYRQYLAAALASLDGTGVLVSDIHSYYTNICQGTLMETLRKRLGKLPSCCALLACSVSRDCGGGHDSGYGLLQGHSLSGVLANVMLQPVDERLVSSRRLRGRYFRFADDMIVTQVADAGPQIRQSLDEELCARHPRLTRNARKTRDYTDSGFRRRYSGSRELDALAKRFAALLLPVFVTNTPFRAAFRRDDWHFIHEYKQVLGAIGLHFSHEWLHRKLYEHRLLHRRISRRFQGFRARRRIGALKRRHHLSWPPLSLVYTASGREIWLQRFTHTNVAWLTEKDSIADELSSILTSAAGALVAGGLSEIEELRYRRRARFALYRLSVLGIGGAAPDVVELVLQQPWQVSVSIACRALANAGCEQELQDIADRSDSSYVCAVALRGLGKTRTTGATTALISRLEGEATAVERLMASEALLDANLWGDISVESVRRWIAAESTSPYIQKNIVLMLAQAYPDEAVPILRQMDRQDLHPVVRRAIHYALTKPLTENLLWRREPRVLRKYRAKSYPTIEELLSDRSYYLLLS